MKRLFLTLLLGALLLPAVAAAAEESTATMPAPHPRLLLTDARLAAMQRFVAKSSNAKAVHDFMVAHAEQLLAEAPVERIMTGRRLLHVSREALQRIFYLAYAWRMSGDERFAVRAEREMLAVCAFNDWNPSHYLDVAEMTVAVSIGYDWLYDWLSEPSRSCIEQAIYEKGLLPSENKKNTKFFVQRSNWNQVCNAGLIYGALATMERYGDYNRALLAKCIASNPLPQRAYGPNGGYPEGYSYWEYGTGFEVLLIEALRTATGEDADLAQYPGFLASAHFMNYMSAPSGRCYNFYDSGAGVGFMPAKYWFAVEMKDSSVVALDEQLLAAGRIPKDRLLPLYLLFGAELDLQKPLYPKARTWKNDGITPVFAYRSGWEQREDSYFAIKGGSPSDHHSHMDGGSFVYEYGGVRWAIELGMHDYNHLETRGVKLWGRQQNSQRWEIFRIGLDSHNTLTINDKRHLVGGRAEILDHWESRRSKGAVLDLTSLYAEDVVRAVRRAELDKHDYLTLTDEIENGAYGSEVLWKMTTHAVPTLVDARTICLEQDGKRLYLTLDAKSRGEALILPPHPYKPYELRDKGVSRVGFRVQLAPAEKQTIKVYLAPEPRR